MLTRSKRRRSVEAFDPEPYQGPRRRLNALSVEEAVMPEMATGIEQGAGPYYAPPRNLDFYKDKPLDYTTYTALKQQGYTLSKRKKKAATRKRPTRRRRSYSYNGSSSRNLSGMGPIVITGRGGYWGDKFGEGASAAWKSLKRATPEGTFGRLGRAAGGAMFGKPGATVGSWLGGGVSDILGFGDYAVKRNDLMMLDEGVPVPTFQNMNDGVIVCHREYIGDVTQSTNFVNNQFIIQPGDSTTFPWLNQIAHQFEQYEILGMIFQYRSTASDFGTTSNMAMGSVIMATEYDTVDAAYGSKLEMENSQYAMSGKPSHDLIHPIECDPGVVGPMGLKYVRTGPVPTGKDNRLYDHGNFQIATTGMPSASGTIGELWVTYKIAFYKPQFNLGSDIKSDIFFGTAGVASNSPFPVSPQPGNSTGCIVSQGAITFPSNAPVGSKWLISLFVVGASTGGMVVSAFNLAGCTSLYQNSNPSVATTTDRVNQNMLIRITAPGAVVGGNTMTVPGSVTSAQLFITQFDSEAV
nr:putative capsid protein [Crucivirus sp.]